MFNSIILDVAIGLVFIYVLYSLFATIINELLATVFSMRAQKLKYAIKRMLTDNKENKESQLGEKLFKEFITHPLNTYMSTEIIKRSPSYISSGNFSKILLDILNGYDLNDDEIKSKNIIKKLESLGKDPNKEKWQSDTIKLIGSFLKDAGSDIDKFKKYIEKWFNDMMDRVSGWYKRQTQYIILAIGFVIALSFNVNTLEIAKRLSTDKIAREQLVQMATNYVIDRQLFVKDSVVAKRLDSLVIRADSLFKADIEPVNQIINIGWNSWGDFWGDFLYNIIGCLITALAISLGAPFWFDLLNKFIKLRGTGVNPSEKPEEKIKVLNEVKEEMIK